MSSEKTNRVEKINESVVRILLFIASWVLAGMMFLTFANVFLRKVFTAPILGTPELIDFGMAIVASFSVVYTAFQRGHVSVDFIIERFPQKIQKVLDIITRAMMLALVIAIAWESFIYVSDEYQSHLVSPTLYIPVPPFIALMAIGFLCFCIVLLSQLISKFHEVVSTWTR